jgi:sodium transport system permease protein
MTFFHGLRAVFRKEVRDHLRDRRSMTSAFMMPMLGPIMFALTFTALANMMREDRPLVVAVLHPERAPNLIAFLERSGATIQPATGNEESEASIEEEVRSGKLDLALEIPDDYAKKFSEGRSAKLQLVVDNSRSKTHTQVRRVQQILHGYSSQMGSLRLLARGVSPELANAMQIEEVDVATPEKVAAAMLSVVPLFLLLSVFAGGMYLAIDSMAGERERGSLEPLLLNPVTRAQVVLGKWGAVVLASWAALGIAITGFSIALRHVPLQDLGVRAQLGSHEILGAMLVLMPLGFFASALQMVLALFARTYKEAQTYLSLMMIIPMLPAAFLSISPVEGKAWMMLVPVLGHTVLLNEVLRGDAIHYSWAAIAAVVAIAAAALSALWAQRMLSQEKIIFGRGAGA